MADSMPQDGDIVIRLQRGNGESTFVLRTLPGPDQFTVPTRGAAVAAAIEVALREHVCVWSIDADGAFTLLNDFRADTATADASASSTDAARGIRGSRKS
jgi:hypothetical protein